MDQLGLKKECGVTAVSLSNARVLIALSGPPTQVRLFYNDRDWEVVEAFFEVYGAIEFTGFSWGYGGEGPHGLAEFFKMIGATQITVEKIAGWKKWSDDQQPGRDYHVATFTRGEHY